MRNAEFEGRNTDQSRTRRPHSAFRVPHSMTQLYLLIIFSESAEIIMLPP
jgi:hypothetical protein